MATETKDLIVRLSMENGKFNSSVKSVDTKLKKTGNRIKKVKKETAFLSKGLLLAAGSLFVVGRAFTSMFKKAAAFEQLNVAFATFLGSAEKGKKAIQELEQFSIVTPFTVDQVNKAGKTLLAFGIEAKKLVTTLGFLGDVAAGTGVPLEQIALVFGQIQSTGRLMGQDLLQLVNAGFNPLQSISAKTGRSMKDLKKDMEKGAISFEMVETAFKDATGEGGKFFNLMNKQSKTVSGRISTLSGNIAILARNIGGGLLPAVKDFVTFFNDLITGTTDAKVAMRNFNEAIDEQVKLELELDKVKKGVIEGNKEELELGLKIQKLKVKEEKEKLIELEESLGEEIAETNKKENELLETTQEAIGQLIAFRRATNKFARGRRHLSNEANVLGISEERLVRILEDENSTLIQLGILQEGVIDSKEELKNKDKKLIEQKQIQNKLAQDEIALIKEKKKTIIGAEAGAEANEQERLANIKLAKEKDLASDILKERQELADKTVAIVGDMSDQIFSIVNKNFQNQIDLLDNELLVFKNTQDEELIILQNKLKEGSLSQADFETQKQALENETFEEEKRIQKEQAEIKRKQFEADKAAAIISVIISTAQGVMAAFKNSWEEGVIVGALLSALGTAQVAAIASQPTPEFARGGIIGGLGNANAPGNEDGFIAAQNGEAVLTRDATATLGADAIEALNEGRGLSQNVTININGGNQGEIVNTLNDYFKSFGGGRDLQIG